MLPATTKRVNESTAAHINERIRTDTEDRIRKVMSGGNRAINRRLVELDREWDIERVLEANAASATIIGSVLGLTVDRRWMLLPVAVGGFLLQHALQGWCPPLIWFRRMGVRTASEIDYERTSLKAIRGDFEDADEGGAHAAMVAARK